MNIDGVDLSLDNLGQDLLELLVGQRWPNGDEGAMRSLASAWQDAATKIDQIRVTASRAAQQVGEYCQGANGQSFQSFWSANFDDGQSSWPAGSAPAALPFAVQFCTSMANALNAGATQIETTKDTIMGNIAILVATVAPQIAAGFFDFGVTDATALAEIAADRTVMEAILDTAKDLIAEAVEQAVTQGLQQAELNFLIQFKEVEEGHASGINLTEVGETGLSGAAGGAMGASFGFALGKTGGAMFGEDFGKSFTGKAFTGVASGVLTNAGLDLVENGKISASDFTKGSLAGMLGGLGGAEAAAGDRPNIHMADLPASVDADSAIAPPDIGPAQRAEPTQLSGVADTRPASDLDTTLAAAQTGPGIRTDPTSSGADSGPGSGSGAGSGSGTGNGPADFSPALAAPSMISRILSGGDAGGSTPSAYDASSGGSSGTSLSGFSSPSARDVPASGAYDAGTGTVTPSGSDSSGGFAGLASPETGSPAGASRVGYSGPPATDLPRGTTGYSSADASSGLGTADAAPSAYSDSGGSNAPGLTDPSGLGSSARLDASGSSGPPATLASEPSGTGNASSFGDSGGGTDGIAATDSTSAAGVTDGATLPTARAADPGSIATPLETAGSATRTEPSPATFTADQGAVSYDPRGPVSGESPVSSLDPRYGTVPDPGPGSREPQSTATGFDASSEPTTSDHFDSQPDSAYAAGERPAGPTSTADGPTGTSPDLGPGAREAQSTATGFDSSSEPTTPDHFDGQPDAAYAAGERPTGLTPAADRPTGTDPSRSADPAAAPESAVSAHPDAAPDFAVSPDRAGSPDHAASPDPAYSPEAVAPSEAPVSPDSAVPPESAGGAPRDDTFVAVVPGLSEPRATDQVRGFDTDVEPTEATPDSGLTHLSDDPDTDSADAPNRELAPATAGDPPARDASRPGDSSQPDADRSTPEASKPDAPGPDADPARPEATRPEDGASRPDAPAHPEPDANREPGAPWHSELGDRVRDPAPESGPWTPQHELTGELAEVSARAVVSEHGISHFADPELADLARRVPPDPDGAFTGDIHGDGEGVFSGFTRMTPEDYLRVLDANGHEPGQAIRLLSCEAGAADDGFAAELARVSGCKVTAADTEVWSDDAGHVFASRSHIDGFGDAAPDIPPNGSWHEFSPDGTKAEVGTDGFPPGQEEGFGNWRAPVGRVRSRAEEAEQDGGSGDDTPVPGRRDETGTPEHPPTTPADGPGDSGDRSGEDRPRQPVPDSAAARPSSESAPPGSEFLGRTEPASPEHLFEVRARFGPAVHDAVEAHPGLRVDAADPVEREYGITDDGGVDGTGERGFTVRVETRPLRDDIPARSVLDEDGRHVIQVSDRISPDYVERAVAQKIGEIVADRRGHTVDGPDAPDPHEDTLRPDGPVDEAGLTPHDAGRVQELRVVGEQLDRFSPENRRTLDERAQYDNAHREAMALVEHLGLREGTPGAAERRALIHGSRLLDDAGRAHVDRLLADAGGHPDTLSPADRQALGTIHTLARLGEVQEHALLPVVQMERLRGVKATWANWAERNRQFEQWARSPEEGPLPHLTWDTKINCWEMVLYSGLSSDPPVLTHAKAHEIYTFKTGDQDENGVPTEQWFNRVAEQLAPVRQEYRLDDPNSPWPRPGDVVFWNGTGHVAIATGKYSLDKSPEVLTFWPPPGEHAPNELKNWSRLDAVKVSSIRELHDYMMDPPKPSAKNSYLDKNGKVVVEFGPGPWEPPENMPDDVWSRYGRPRTVKRVSPLLE